MAKVLEDLYGEYNSRYWNNTLPDIPVRWKNNLVIDGCDCYGATLFTRQGNLILPKTILIDAQLKGFADWAQFTLHHEAIHVALPYPKNGNFHGSAFHKQMLRLAREGAFRSIW